MAQNKEHYSYSFNRIYFDNEIFKQYQGNGKIIKMLVDPKDLADAKDFWKSEEDITKLARKYMTDLKKRKVYDFHDVNPEAYNLKGEG